jgi:hypothetical protein
MLFITGYLRTAMLWAMIPLTVFASSPAIGCTCASGEYKIFCVAHLAKSRDALDARANGGACEKNCCHHKGGSQAVEFRQTEACPISDSHNTHGGKQCCNPDSPKAIAVSSVVKIAPPLGDVMFFDLPSADIWHAFSVSTATHAVEHDTGPPGGDLVISLRRLLV